ncbi:hypothetical protein AJ87_37860 [Rhizobium yanglingense]|nr:hypothetical protein AJ87_37860 [Rhizobium yanglingense]
MNENIEQITDPKDRGGEKLLRIADFDGLVALVQSAVLEIHPWGATTDIWEKPDMITMDLDPGGEVAWDNVIAAAREIKERLEAEGLAGFVKTSGGKGLHVVTPLKPKAGWAEVKAFAKRLADTMAAESPDRYIAKATKAERTGKIFIDYLRNGRGNTAVAAYSTRARPGAAVSMPLEWTELTADIGPAYFTIENTPPRLDALPKDPWDGFFAAAKPLEKRRSVSAWQWPAVSLSRGGETDNALVPATRLPSQLRRAGRARIWWRLPGRSSHSLAQLPPVRSPWH